MVPSGLVAYARCYATSLPPFFYIAWCLRVSNVVFLRFNVIAYNVYARCCAFWVRNAILTPCGLVLVRYWLLFLNEDSTFHQNKSKKIPLEKKKISIVGTRLKTDWNPSNTTYCTEELNRVPFNWPLIMPRDINISTEDEKNQVRASVHIYRKKIYINSHLL